MFMLIRSNSLFAVYENKNDTLFKGVKVEDEDIIPDDCCCCSSGLNCGGIQLPDTPDTEHCITIKK
jgi:hypothetical protein